MFFCAKVIMTKGLTLKVDKSLRIYVFVVKRWAKKKKKKKKQQQKNKTKQKNNNNKKKHQTFWKMLTSCPAISAISIV